MEPEPELQLRDAEKCSRVHHYLARKGVPDPIAEILSINEFLYWEEEEVSKLFNHVDPKIGNVRIPDLKSFRVQLSPEEAAAGVGPTDFVKPSWEQIMQSASTLGALCVNSNGEFCINPPEGYAALSHVWAEGLGSNPKNRGLHRSLIKQVFDKMEPLNIGWLWIDGLAIPGSGHNLTEVEEGLKSRLINAMADIYRLARLVIVFDALLLQTQSEDPLVILSLLCCGRES